MTFSSIRRDWPADPRIYSHSTGQNCSIKDWWRGACVASATMHVADGSQVPINGFVVGGSYPPPVGIGRTRDGSEAYEVTLDVADGGTCRRPGLACPSARSRTGVERRRLAGAAVCL